MSRTSRDEDVPYGVPSPGKSYQFQSPPQRARARTYSSGEEDPVSSSSYEASSSSNHHTQQQGGVWTRAANALLLRNPTSPEEDNFENDSTGHVTTYGATATTPTTTPATTTSANPGYGSTIPSISSSAAPQIWSQPGHPLVQSRSVREEQSLLGMNSGSPHAFSPSPLHSRKPPTSRSRSRTRDPPEPTNLQNVSMHTNTSTSVTPNTNTNPNDPAYISRNLFPDGEDGHGHGHGHPPPPPSNGHGHRRTKSEKEGHSSPLLRYINTASSGGGGYGSSGDGNIGNGTTPSPSNNNNTMGRHHRNYLDGLRAERTLPPHSPSMIADRKRGIFQPPRRSYSPVPQIETSTFNPMTSSSHGSHHVRHRSDSEMSAMSYASATSVVSVTTSVVADITKSSLFRGVTGSGRIIFHAPVDKVHLVMDPDLERGHIYKLADDCDTENLDSMEDYYRYLEAGNNGGCKCNCDNCNDCDSKLQQKIPPARYLLTVRSDLYQRLFKEIDDSRNMPCRLFYCGHYEDVDHPSICIAVVIVTLFFAAMVFVAYAYE